jgi:threonine dehydrogenase-like Zn-dependent dehydrogenase
VPVIRVVLPAVRRASCERGTPGPRSRSRARVPRLLICSVPFAVASVTTRAATNRTRFWLTAYVPPRRASMVPVRPLYDAVLVRDDSLAQALRDETGGRGADVILDPQGTDLLELDLGLAAPGARIVLFGNAAGGTLGPLPPAAALFAVNAMIGGFSLSRMATQLPERVVGTLHDVLQRLPTGALDVELHELEGFESAPRAHDELAAGLGSGKRVVRLA